MTARAISSIVLLASAIAALLVSLQSTESAAGATRLLMFRTLAPPESHGRVALLNLDRPDGERQISALSCARLHYAGGRGLCLTQESAANANTSTYAAYIFDRTLTPGRRIALNGVPIRVRVAPNGRYGAVTTNFEEESPTGERLAIDSVVVDMATGRLLAPLHDFHIDHGGFPPLTPPIDVAGVAFERDGDRFFASVSTSTERYLVAGSIGERRMTTIRTGVASESLSPDGSQLLVKKLAANGFWQLAVIDLRTWSERDLQQGPRSVDDQVEWLDDQHVLYHDVDEHGTSLWILPVDGINGPRILVKDAYSGVVQR